MTRNTEQRSTPTDSPALPTAMFVAAKDPNVHFGDSRPAFAGHGAVIAEYPDSAFHGHLMEMLAEEDPELLDSIVSIPDEGISAGVLIRARKELDRTKRVARNLDTDQATKDARFYALATLSLRLRRHAVELKQVLPDIIHRSNCRQLEIRQSGQLVLECWRLISEIMSVSSPYSCSIPHPLAREAESLRLVLERALPKLHACRNYESGSRALHGSIDAFMIFEPDACGFGDEYHLDVIQTAEAFITRVAAEHGDGTDLIGRKDRELLASLEERIARHVSLVRSVREEEWREAAATDATAPSGGGPAESRKDPPKASSRESPSQTPVREAHEEMPMEESDWTKRFSLGAGLVIDPSARTVALDGTPSAKRLSIGQFKLLMVLAKNRGRWVEAERLTEPDGPWHTKEAPNPATLRTAISRLRTALKPLDVLGEALESESDQLHGTARLLWPPPARGN